MTLIIIFTGDDEDSATKKDASQVVGSITADNGPPYLDSNSTEDEGDGDDKEPAEVYETLKDEDNAEDEVKDEDDDEEVEVEVEDGASIDSAPIIVSDLPGDIDDADNADDEVKLEDEDEDEEVEVEDGASIDNRPDLYSVSDENMDDSEGEGDRDTRSDPAPSEDEPPQDDIDCEELEHVLASLGGPTVTVTKYPGGLAGMAHSTGKITENQNYEAKVGEWSQENPYAPFASSLEWQIAKWAKLRGPSSTAFTELIAIDGVS